MCESVPFLNVLVYVRVLSMYPCVLLCRRTCWISHMQPFNHIPFCTISFLLRDYRNLHPICLHIRPYPLSTCNLKAVVWVWGFYWMYVSSGLPRWAGRCKCKSQRWEKLYVKELKPISRLWTYRGSQSVSEPPKWEHLCRSFFWLMWWFVHVSIKWNQDFGL